MRFTIWSIGLCYDAIKLTFKVYEILLFGKQKLFERAKTDSVLKERMAEAGVLFFLHLGGLDHSGYIVRPNSE